MKRPELLAPAGSKEAFYAAIEAGCDAVYIGGYTFGARAFADNFSNEEIVECIKYAHLYGVKVYITVNTIVYEKEVELFMNYIDFLHQNNVDAIIIQDLGMFDLVRKTYPNLELHASTQMHIYNEKGVKLAHELGFKRVVLARETNIDMIKKIKANCDAELEVFVHGALCISYSGQCLMSSLIGGRSGNRGKCAGTCRLEYNLIDENGKKYNNDKYLLSTKDLMTINNIGELIELGIDSFKIEGRMKRPEYVYLVVSLYRKAIDSYLKDGNINITTSDIEELKKIYNRKFTNGYLFNSKTVINQYRPNHLGIEVGKVISINKNEIVIKCSNELNKNDGIRFLNKEEDTGLIITKMYVLGKEVESAYKGDIVTIKANLNCDKGSIVIKTTDNNQISNINSILKNKSRKVLIDGFIKIEAGKSILVNITDGTNKISYESDHITEFSNKISMKDTDVKKQLLKTNDTVYKFNKLEVEIDNKSFIPVSKLNEIRRIVLALLDEKRLYKIDYIKRNYSINVPDFKRCECKTALVYDIDSYNKIKNNNFENIYMNKKLYEKIDDKRKVLRLNRVNYDKNKACLVCDFGSLIDNCYTDFSFNVVNSYAVAFLHSLGVNRITLSLELNDEQINDIVLCYEARYQKNPNLELMVYGNEEMMISKFNLLDGLENKNYYLQDKYFNKFSIMYEDNIMTIFNYKQRNIKDYSKYYKMGINYVRFSYKKT